MKKILSLFLGLSLGILAHAQTLHEITGDLSDADTSLPLAEVVVSVQNTNISVKSDANGHFSLKNVPEGHQVVVVSKAGYETQYFPVEVTKPQTALGSILMYIDYTQRIDNSVVTLSDDDLSDDEAGGADNVAGILQSSKDVYQRAVAYNFGQVWFKERGYDSGYGQVAFNGMPMNKISNNRPQWSDWGGLNDVLRNQVFTPGLAASETSFGNVLGTTNFITRASKYREGGKISYAFTNSNYNGRAMASYNTGLLENGWALSVLGSRRYAQEAYIEGTSYNAWGGFIAVEKKLSEHQSVNFTAFYTPNRRGKNSPNTQEVFDLGGLKYNAYWGYQGDRKRNARMKEIKEPTFMLGHYWDINTYTSLNTNIMYQKGTIGNSRLGYLGVNPDPTYYQNLPSYSLIPGKEDYANAHEITYAFLHKTPDSQLQWDALYAANALSDDAFYYQYEDVNDDRVMAVNSVLNTKLNDIITLNASVLYKKVTSENYARMMDLLGANHFTDKDKYATGDFAQNDLNHPDRSIYTGDKFSYDYLIDAGIFDAFAQTQFAYDAVDFYVAGNFGSTTYQREGLYKNGQYAGNSFGKGNRKQFPTYGVKTGLTYKITGRQLLHFNAGYMTKAPSLRNTYINPRVRHDFVDGITTEKILSADASYIFRAPGVKARLTGYYTSFKDLSKVSYYYVQGIAGEGSVDSNFLTTAISGMQKKNLGGEFGLEAAVTPTLSITGVAAVGQFTYANNPTLSAYYFEDSTPYSIQDKTVYLNNYKQSGTPQQGYSLGFSYRDPKYWWVSANANLLRNNYISLSEFRRTDNFYLDSFGNPVPLVGATQEEVDRILAQEKFDDIFLVNLVGGKSWKVDGKYFGFFASINNLLGETFKTGGFEQARKANFEELSQDQNLENPLFGNKYWYGRGTSYYLNFYVRF